MLDTTKTISPADRGVLEGDKRMLPWREVCSFDAMTEMVSAAI